MCDLLAFCFGEDASGFSKKATKPLDVLVSEAKLLDRFQIKADYPASVHSVLSTCYGAALPAGYAVAGRAIWPGVMVLRVRCLH
jgi:hypothetical protein